MIWANNFLLSTGVETVMAITVTFCSNRKKEVSQKGEHRKTIYQSGTSKWKARRIQESAILNIKKFKATIRVTTYTNYNFPSSFHTETFTIPSGLHVHFSFRSRSNNKADNDIHTKFNKQLRCLDPRKNEIEKNDRVLSYNWWQAFKILQHTMYQGITSFPVILFLDCSNKIKNKK